ncbi:TIGR00268 family protein [Methanobrevibacter sp. DSM 116169]|uniref:DUF7411 family protein n=1 Tax=Methanobrevibacter sp. DSM 116169 TaxID=3242727 RepID=UPI0038FC350A
MKDHKIEKVKSLLEGKKIAIAFSGGADSTLLAYIASKVSKDVLLITIDNNLMPTNFLNDSKKIANNLNLKQVIVKDDFYSFDEFLENKDNRCYICREKMYKHIIHVAKSNGFDIVADGTNISDLVDNRPGILINYKNNILSPFVYGCLESYEIHKCLDELNIDYLKASTCLATRISGNLTKEEISKVQLAEDFIKNNTDCEIVKVRLKNKLAICEVDNFTYFLDKNVRNKIIDYLNSLGFQKVYLNLREIQDNEKIFIDCFEDGNYYSFTYHLPYEINLNETLKILKNNKIVISENGEITGRKFKSKKEAKEVFLSVLPLLRRKI